ncbi:MAG: DUF167 domain-containing protein [Candidatus Omnitrophota bacterium]
MKIEALTKPNAKQDKVEMAAPGLYRVWVKAPAVEGKANEAVVEVLSGYFGIPRSRIALLKGKRSKRKLFEIPNISSA